MTQKQLQQEIRNILYKEFIPMLTEVIKESQLTQMKLIDKKIKKLLEVKTPINSNRQVLPTVPNTKNAITNELLKDTMRNLLNTPDEDLNEGVYLGMQPETSQPSFKDLMNGTVPTQNEVSQVSDNFNSLPPALQKVFSTDYSEIAKKITQRQKGK